MNVSLSRAKYSLIIVGDMRKLKMSNIWMKLINYSIAIERAFKISNPLENSLDNIINNPSDYRISEIP